MNKHFDPRFIDPSCPKKERVSTMNRYIEPRFIDLCKRSRRYNEADAIDSDYAAALWVLASDWELYEISCKYVDHEGVDFAGIKKAICRMDEPIRHIVDIAHNLFSYDSKCDATPFEISRLDVRNINTVFEAILIAGCKSEVYIKDNTVVLKQKGD